MRMSTTGRELQSGKQPTLSLGLSCTPSQTGAPSTSIQKPLLPRSRPQHHGLLDIVIIMGIHEGFPVPSSGPLTHFPYGRVSFGGGWGVLPKKQETETPKQAPRPGRSPPQGPSHGSEIMTPTQVKSQMLNRLRSPGAPVVFFLKAHWLSS